MKKIIIILPIALFVLQTASAQSIPLSVDDAVKQALDSDARIQSTLMDLDTSSAKLEEARRRRYPSLSVSGSYTRLSDVSSSINLGTYQMDINSQDDAFSLAANLQYPVFAGFRLRKSIELAELQTRGKKISAAMIRQAVIFETQRAYWEAVRSEHNANMLKENLVLVEHNRDVIKQKLVQGTVLNADLLSAEQKCSQAKLDLEDALSFQKKVGLNLEALVSRLNTEDSKNSTAQNKDFLTAYRLVSQPEKLAFSGNAKKALGGTIDEQELISKALAIRPEIQAAALSVQVAEKSFELSNAPLYPTLAVNGNYTYANPNSRVLFPSESKFSGTWNIGISLSYDLGAVPANLSEVKAREAGIKKNEADRDRQEEQVIMDVRKSVLSYKQAKNDIDLVAHMLDQAKENERVMKERVKTGVASDLDQLGTSIARLQIEFTIVNKQIDLQIAAADLCRAVGLNEAQ